MSTTRATTKKIYLSDPDKFSHTATVTAITSENDIVTVMLSETIFHPQGGGQPSDKGTINGITVETATKVGDAFDFDVGHHFKTTDTLNFQVGDTVTLEVDAANRKLLSRLHTAGHLISNHVQTMFGHKYAKCHLYPDKGIFLVFDPESTLPSKQTATTSSTATPPKAAPKKNAAPAASDLISEQNLQDLAKVCATDIKEDLPITEVALEGEDAGKRGIQIGTYSPFPCAGTHVPLSQIGSILFEKVKKDKNGLKISYHLEEPKDIKPRQ